MLLSANVNLGYHEPLQSIAVLVFIFSVSSALLSRDTLKPHPAEIHSNGHRKRIATYPLRQARTYTCSDRRYIALLFPCTGDSVVLLCLTYLLSYKHFHRMGSWATPSTTLMPIDISCGETESATVRISLAFTRSRMSEDMITSKRNCSEF